MLTKTALPGASDPPAGLKEMLVEILLKANQLRVVWLPGSAITSAVQIKSVPLFLQSRCPTKLIDDGRRSRIGAGGGGGGGACVGGGGGTGVGVGVGVGIGAGVAVGVGASVGVGVGLALLCAVGAEPPHAVRKKLTSTTMASTNRTFRARVPRNVREAQAGR